MSDFTRSSHYYAKQPTGRSDAEPEGHLTEDHRRPPRSAGGLGYNASQLTTYPSSTVRRSPQTAHQEKSGRPEIKFYEEHQRYYEFTNFSPNPVYYDGKMYPTSEHLFQSMKFENEADAETIRTQRTPRQALQMAQDMHVKAKRGWVKDGLNIMAMEDALLAKFSQSSYLKGLLLSTNDAILIEDSPVDPFWGVGADGHGRNQLGIALMKIRDVLKAF